MDQFRSLSRVVGARIEGDRNRDDPFARHQKPMDLERGIDTETCRNTGGVVENLEPACRTVNLCLQHVVFTMYSMRVTTASQTG